MSIGERRSAFCEGVNVRCLDLGVTTVAAQPVVQVIDGNEQHVASFQRSRRRGSQQHQGDQAIEISSQTLC